MHLSAAMKGLLDKEWRHSRGYLLVTLLIIIYAPVFITIFRLMHGDAALTQWGHELNYALNFGTSLTQGRLDAYTGFLEWLPFTGSVLLGVITLGTEQHSGLKYLVSTPVSRRQIILSKFIPGVTTILAAMLINALFLMALNWIHPMPFESRDVLNWTLLAGALCLIYFTLGLMAATFSVGVLAAGIMVFLLTILPGMLTGMIGNIAARYFAVSQAVSVRIYTIGSYFSLHDYIFRSGRDIDYIQHYTNFITITGVSSNSIKGPDYLLESALLLLGLLLILLVAVIIFERVSLSASGTIFASNRGRQLGLAAGSAYLSYVAVLPRTDSLFTFIIFWSFLTGLIYSIPVWLFRLRRQNRSLFPGKTRS